MQNFYLKEGLKKQSVTLFSIKAAIRYCYDLAQSKITGFGILNNIFYVPNHNLWETGQLPNSMEGKLFEIHLTQSESQLSQWKRFEMYQIFFFLIEIEILSLKHYETGLVHNTTNIASKVCRYKNCIVFVPADLVSNFWCSAQNMRKRCPSFWTGFICDSTFYRALCSWLHPAVPFLHFLHWL